MTLEELHDEWDKDSKFNQLNIPGEVQKNLELHSKYWRILTAEQFKYAQQEIVLSQLKHDKLEFYMHGHDEVTRAKGWELPPKGRITVREDAKRTTEIDKEVIQKTLSFAVVSSKVKFLESIIHQINNRNYSIKSFIEHKKYEAGG